MPENIVNVFDVFGSTKSNAYFSHCMVLVMNMATRGARYGDHNTFMELRSGRMIRQPSLEKTDFYEDCLLDGYWDHTLCT